MKKHFNLKYGSIEEAIKQLHHYGIRLYGTFLFGYDHDQTDDLTKTVRFAINNRLFIAAFNHLVPFPGTPLYERIENEGRLISDKWWLDDGFVFGSVPFKPKNISADQVKSRCIEARKEFYAYKSIFYRFVEKVNRRQLSMAGTYFIANLLLKKEISQKTTIPLGIKTD